MGGLESGIVCSITVERKQVAKPNYQYEKRQRELEKKKKKAEKAQRKSSPTEDSPTEDSAADDSPDTFPPTAPADIRPEPK
jgi:hypothetical protein